MLQSYCGVRSTGKLTPTDIAGAQLLYGRPSDDFIWWMDGDMAEIQQRDVPRRVAITYDPETISAGHQPVTGDFDGDGYGDIFW